MSIINNWISPSLESVLCVTTGHVEPYPWIIVKRISKTVHKVHKIIPRAGKADASPAQNGKMAPAADKLDDVSISGGTSGWSRGPRVPFRLSCDALVSLHLVNHLEKAKEMHRWV